MGDITCSEWIDGSRMPQFQKILSDCGGYFLANPIKSGDRFYCYYSPGDYERLHGLYWLITTPIVEKRRPMKLRVWIRNLFSRPATL